MNSGSVEGRTGDTILLERTDEVLSIKLNRPERLNAFTREMYVALDEVVSRAATDPELRVIVITGAGRAFSTGGDLKQHLERRRRREKWDPVEYIRPSNHAFETLLNIDKVVIAVVNGLAYAAGLIITLCADIVIASERALFCVPEARSGRAEPWTATLLPSRVGRQRAAAMVLTGQPIDAESALVAGLVHTIARQGELRSETEKVVRSVLMGAPIAQRFYLKMLNSVDPTTFDLGSIHETIFSAETLEGTEAFVEERPASWVRSWSWPAEWND